MTEITALARIEFGATDLAEIKASIMPRDGTDAELRHFTAVCQHLGLDPFARQIYAIRREQGKALTIQIGIDGYRSLAEATGEYEGQTAPQWCGEDGQWVDVWLKPVLPAAARVGVYRRGFRDAVYGIALLREFAQSGPTWKAMPSHMLAKVAEVAALKRAFPQVFLTVRQQARAEAVEVADDAAIDAEVRELSPEPAPKPAHGESVAPQPSALAPDLLTRPVTVRVRGAFPDKIMTLTGKGVEGAIYYHESVPADRRLDATALDGDVELKLADFGPAGWRIVGLGDVTQPRPEPAPEQATLEDV